MNWKKIPSLSSLRAFEAVARHKNQSAAAGELNVTQAAINQHMRSLETHLGIKLFERKGRGIKLTDDGQILFEYCQRGFQNIASGISILTDRQSSRPILVSATPAISENWLISNLSRFWEEQPNIKVYIEPSTKLVNLAQDGYDLVIRYGRGEWLGLTSKMLFSSQHIIVAAPSYLENHKQVADDFGKANWIIAKDDAEILLALSNIGIDAKRLEKRIDVANFNLMRAAVLKGYGLGVAKAEIIDAELKQGLLKPIREIELDEEYGYYIAYIPERLSENARIFIKWLQETAQKT